MRRQPAERQNDGASLLEQVAAANTALSEHAAARPSEDFVTGLIGRLDLITGLLELVNAGHATPYLARGGELREVPLPVDIPLGLFASTTYRRSCLPLTPGDRIVLVTDGMLERNAVGLDLPASIKDTRSLHPREAVRALADRVLDATQRSLSDDATVMCLDWHGGHGRDRASATEPTQGSPANRSERSKIPACAPCRADARGAIVQRRTTVRVNTPRRLVATG